MYTDEETLPHGGKVEFTRYGDIVRLCDVDGDRKYVWLRVGRGRYTLTTRGMDSGECKVRSAGDGGRFDLPEWHDRGMRFKICLAYGDHIKYGCDKAWWETA